MTIQTRRDFIKATTLAGLALAASPYTCKKRAPLLSFTTLGCPDWSLPKVIEFASKNGYAGIEIRGILREMDLTKIPEFSLSNIDTALRMVKDNGLNIICLGSAAHLHDADAEKRKSNLDDVKKFIDLAHKLSSSYVRIFPDVVPEGQERKETADLIIRGLRELGDYAAGSNVSVLLEPNGDFIKAADLSFIMESAAHPQVGLLWNVSAMWSAQKESPSLVYEKLKKYIKHTHIKDLILSKGSVEYDVLLGQGEVPVSAAVKALYKGDYEGYYGCEWEKYWYPNIREPEVALPYFSKEIKTYFKS